MDAPGNGSKTSMYQNVIESCSLLNPFEDVFHSILPTFKAYGYQIYDVADFESKIKPFYQKLRHGLAFDWVLNHILNKIYTTFPFCHFNKFKGTDPFIKLHTEDEVFKNELRSLDEDYNKLLSVLFEGLDKTVFTRLVKDSGTTDFIKCVIWARDNNKIQDYFITEQLIYNMNYLVALGLMLDKSIGIVKRGIWHEKFEKIKNKEIDGVIICGGKFRAFGYGTIWDRETPKWHLFDMGIIVDPNSCRSQRKEFLRVFPDEMTFFRFTPHSITLDESFFPYISFDDGKTWFNTLQFSKEKNLPLDKPVKMKIKYKFKQDPDNPRLIKVKAHENCVVKDAELILDENGIAETQLIFRGESVGFKISEDKKEYPFAVFENSNLKIKDFDWLE